MKLYFVFFCFVIINASLLISCTSQERDKSALIKKESDPMVTRFFEQIKTGKYLDALDNLLKLNEYIDRSDSSFQKLTDGFKQINEFSGRFTGYKLLKERAIENELLIRSYLVKYERKFYRFIFTFYRADKTVNIFKFAYDDLIDFELEEAIKLYTQ